MEMINKAIEILSSGGTILYPTDTIWGIGCDATDTNAVQKNNRCKKAEIKVKALLFW
jgi:translation factor SUA5